MGATIFEQLYAATEKHVKSFKSDFEYDKKSIERNPQTSFIHIARNTGTALVTLHKSDQYPQRGEEITYLFGKAKREAILKGKRVSIEHYTENNPKSFYYFDGKTLKKISKEKAIQIFEAYSNRLMAEWEQEERNTNNQ